VSHFKLSSFQTTPREKERLFPFEQAPTLKKRGLSPANQIDFVLSGASLKFKRLTSRITRHCPPALPTTFLTFFL
jgi:hypothetical protein